MEFNWRAFLHDQNAYSSIRWLESYFQYKKIKLSTVSICSISTDEIIDENCSIRILKNIQLLQQKILQHDRKK